MAEAGASRARGTETGRSARSFLFKGSKPALAKLAEGFCARLFPTLPQSYVADRLPYVHQPDLFLAEQNGRLVGFKLGYRSSATGYTSWLGGVDEDCRRQGIATTLTGLQHAHARQLGIASVETRTRASNPAMLIVNLRAGFQVIGVEADALGRFVVLLRKDWS